MNESFRVWLAKHAGARARDRVAVCGGRDYDDLQRVWDVLSVINSRSIIHGGAKGADSLAGQFAKVSRTPVHVYLADWSKHGRAAGPLRNEQILAEGNPTMLVAFPGGKGTAHMVKIAKAAGVFVMEVPSLTGGLRGFTFQAAYVDEFNLWR